MQIQCGINCKCKECILIKLQYKYFEQKAPEYLCYKVGLSGVPVLTERYCVIMLIATGPLDPVGYTQWTWQPGLGKPCCIREIPGGVYLSGYANLCVLRHHSLASRYKQRENSVYKYMQTGRFCGLIKVEHLNILMDICKRIPL